MNKTRTMHIRLSDKEYDLIKQKMAEANMSNMSRYMLKMAIDGMIINLDMPELKEIAALMKHNGNNLNQIAKRLNEGRSIYAADISEIKDTERRSRIWCAGHF